MVSTDVSPEWDGGFTISSGLFLVYPNTEVRGVVGSRCWRTRAMPHAAGRCEGMEAQKYDAVRETYGYNIY